MSDLEDSNAGSTGERTPCREKQLLDEEDDGGDETMEVEGQQSAQPPLQLPPPAAGATPSQKNVDAVPPAESPADTGSSSSSGSATLRRDLASSGSSIAASSATCSGLPKAYVNVRAAWMAARTVRNLNECAVTNKNTAGSFHVLKDNRIFLAHNRHCYSTKMNISASFNLENLTCNNCTFRGEHTVLSRDIVETSRASLRAFLGEGIFTPSSAGESGSQYASETVQSGSHLASDKNAGSHAASAHWPMNMLLTKCQSGTDLACLESNGYRSVPNSSRKSNGGHMWGYSRGRGRSQKFTP
jgi:hypothetical protein